MELNGKDDSFARWLQGVCALLLFGVLLFLVWMLRDLDSTESDGYFWLVGLAVAIAFLVVRCGWYAITGEGNINRDVLNSTRVGGGFDDE